MRLAAAVVELAPNQTRRAHVLYAQAQAELRYSGREVSGALQESVASGMELRSESAELKARATRARERAHELAHEANRLSALAEALVSANQPLQKSVAAAFQEEVERFSVAARGAGEPPEQALLRLKVAIEPALAAAFDRRDDIMIRAVDWFVHAYYPG